MEKIKLFCFPYGGGSATIYYEWKKLLAPSIELFPVELAARGSRLGEEHYGSLLEAVDDVFHIIEKHLVTSPYALYGHSLGAMIAYELAHKIKAAGLPGPLHMFISGRSAPHAPWHKDFKHHTLAEDKFREEVLKLGGIPKEFTEEPDLLDIIFKILRGDYRLAETYVYKEKDSLLDCNITVMEGEDDEHPKEDILSWKIHTRKNCEVYFFPGGHFYIREETQKIVDIINRKLALEKSF